MPEMKILSGASPFINATTITTAVHEMSYWVSLGSIISYLLRAHHWSYPVFGDV